MTPQEKLTALGLTYYGLATRAGLTSSGVRKVFVGVVPTPAFDTIARIHLATEGKISFRDFVKPDLAADVSRRIEEYGPLLLGFARRTPGTRQRGFSIDRNDQPPRRKQRKRTGIVNHLSE